MVRPAGPVVVLLAVCCLAPVMASAGSSSSSRPTSERAICPYREEVRSFGKGAEEFNMTVAVGGRAGSCGKDSECEPFNTIVKFQAGGKQRKRQVTVAWLCVRKRDKRAPDAAEDANKKNAKDTNKKKKPKQICLENMGKDSRRPGKLSKQERRQLKDCVQELRKFLRKQRQEARRQQKAEKQRQQKLKKQRQQKSKKQRKSKSKEAAKDTRVR